MGKFWTPRREAELKELADRGCSTGDIAKAMGTTRRAIQAKVHRDGIKLKQTFGPHNWRKGLDRINSAKVRPFKGFSIPERAHPLVKELFAEALEQQITLRELGRRSGITYEAIQGWRRRDPQLCSIDACFGVLGKRLSTSEALE